MPRGQHQHSRDAYEAVQPALGARARLILVELRAHGPGTDRELMRRLGFNDLNQVRPRITELVKDGYVREAGERRCSITGCTVRVVEAVYAPRQLTFPGVR